MTGLARFHKTLKGKREASFEDPGANLRFGGFSGQSSCLLTCSPQRSQLSDPHGTALTDEASIS